ncbi:O-antigen ligase family protein [Halomonas nitroreducens]|uniref:O-antigen ligase family protein n=2 Tax=Halomonas nitroreducens TaxID=447425 RepID=A0A3S0J6E3_9GAMM|nr:O-antigen ligase family protein [Halomonas nitroreducens]
MAYAGLRIAFPEVGELTGTLMALLGLFAVLRWGQRLRSSAPLWLLLAVVLVQLIAWTSGYFHHPDWLPDNPELDRLAKWFLFIGMAWWLGGCTRLTWMAWAITVPGLLLAVWLEGQGWYSWQRGLAGKRVDFGIQNAQHVSMFFGTALLGLVLFARRAVTIGRFTWWRRMGWVAATVISLVGVVVTQTRGVWLALLVSSMVALVLSGYVAWRRAHSEISLRHVTLWFLVPSLLVVIMASAFHTPIERRLAAENQVIASIVARDWESIPFDTSIGNRVHSWRAAMEWIAERPLVGWGGEGRSLVMDHTEWMPAWNRQEYGHLHNTFLEVFVSYGLLGVLVIGALALWVGLGTFRSWRGGVMPGDMALFGYSFFIFFMIVNMFESFLSFWSGGYVFTIVMGGLVTHIWRWQVETGQRVFPVLRSKAS